MEPGTSTWWSRKRKRWRDHWGNRAVLKCLADLATDDGSLYSVEFLFENDLIRDGERMCYSLSVCRSPTLHSWCRRVAPPFTSPDLNACPLLSLRRTQSRIGDSDFCVQILEAIGRIRGLARARFRFNVGGNEKFVVDRLVPVLLASVCTSGPSSVLKQIAVDMAGDFRSSILDFLQLPNSLPRLEALEIHLSGRFSESLETDAKCLASFLRSNKSLKSLVLNLRTWIWESTSSALEIIMEPLSLMAVSESSRQKDSLVLEKLVLEIEVSYDHNMNHEAQVVRVVAGALDSTGLGLAVGEFWLSLCNSSTCDLIMRMELGAMVELCVPRNPVGHVFVQEVLLLNRGPSVLSVNPRCYEDPSRILSLIVPDENGHQANTCVSTLKLVNGSWTLDAFRSAHTVWDSSSCYSYSVEKWLVAIANMMRTSSTVEHLEVTNQWPGFDLSGCDRMYAPEGSLNIPAVSELRSALRPGGTLRSLTLYGEELGFEEVQERGGGQKKVQCLKKLGSHSKKELAVKVKMVGGNWEILPRDRTSCCGL